LGSWSNSGSTLPVSVYGYGDTFGFVSRSKVFLIHPYGPSGNSKTHYEATINPDGTLGSWTIGSMASMPGMVQKTIYVTSSRVYIVGGYDNVTGYTNAIYSNPITGGTNDYSPYYNGTFVPTDPDNFTLPDYTPFEEPGYYFFIKT
jgi:hypothetical protein